MAKKSKKQKVVVAEKPVEMRHTHPKRDAGVQELVYEFYNGGGKITICPTKMPRKKMAFLTRKSFKALPELTGKQRQRYRLAKEVA